MKKLIKIYSLLATTLLVTLISGCGNEIKQEQISTEQDDTAYAELQDIKEAPLVYTEYLVLKEFANLGYKYIHAEEGPTSPIFIEPKVDLRAFKNKFIVNNTYQGIRIYPAFDTNNKHMFFIICQSNDTDSLEANYMSFTNSEYPNEDSFPAVSDMAQVRPFHESYMSEIRLLSFRQNEPNSPLNNKIRYSRYYSKSKIDSLIIKNNPADSAGFKIQFEFGYIPGVYVRNIQGRTLNDIFSDDELQGYTVMMHIIGADNVDRVDREARYNEGEYRNRYLEVGNPCPPRCGLMHLD